MIFVIITLLLVITIVSSITRIKLSQNEDKYTEVEVWEIITEVFCLCGIISIIICSGAPLI